MDESQTQKGSEVLKKREVGHPLGRVPRSASKTTMLLGYHVPMFVWRVGWTQWLGLKFEMGDLLGVCTAG